MKRSLYEYSDYKKFLNDWVEAQPKQGHGEYRRISLSLKVSTTMVSQVFKGDKHLSLEMACELCEYLSFDEDETEYFLLLVDYQKAGSHKLSNRFLKQIKKRQEQALKLENRIKKSSELSEADKAIFYSSWIYSGISLMTDIDSYNNAADISQKLNLPKNLVQRVISFLLEKGLCVEVAGKLKMGSTSTHVGSSNLLTVKHHQNWRLLGFNKMIFEDDRQLFFTGPMVMSQEVADEIRLQLPELIQDILKKVHPSKSEVVRCLNIDWFEY